MSRHNQPLFTRVGSKFENGFGGEGPVATVIYWILRAFLMLLSAVAFVFVWPFLLKEHLQKRAQKRRAARGQS
jgi:hypothetical protein